MAEMDEKHFRVKDFASLYIDKEKISAFQQYIKISNIEHEDNVILEQTLKGREPTWVLDGSHTTYFYLHLPVIHDLGVLIPFTLFKAEFLEISNVSTYQVTSNIKGFVRVLKIICRRLEVSSSFGIFLSFYGIKLTSKNGYATLCGLPI